MKIIYREARPEDARALLDFLKDIGGESDNLTFGAEGLPTTAEQEAKFLEELQHSTHSKMLMALDGGRIVGNANLSGYNKARFQHRRSLGISVRKSHWGQGIGTELLKRLIEFARSTGAEIIELEVRSDNERAKALYQKFGFRKFGTYEKFFKIDGQYFDADYMTLHL